MTSHRREWKPTRTYTAAPGPLVFESRPGGCVARGKVHVYAIYGEFLSTRGNHWEWTLEVREARDVWGLSTVVGTSPVFTTVRRTRKEAQAVAQGLEEQLLSQPRGHDDTSEE